MKNRISILGIVFLTVVYCFVVGSINSFILYSTYSNNLSATHDSAISDLSVKLVSHTSQSENLFNNCNKLPVSQSKDSFAGLWAVVNVNEQLIKSDFFQYTISLRNILVKYRKNDRIFPFHYFW